MTHPEMSPSFVRRRAALVALLLTALVTVPALAHDGRCGDGHAARHVWVPPIVVPAIPPIPPIPVEVAAASHSHGLHSGHTYWTSDDDGFSWGIVDDHDADVRNGNLDDDERDALRDMAHANGAPVLWFRLDGDEWAVRDRALVQKADRILQPMRDLGREMGRFGREQGRLGARQGRIGARQGRFGAEVGRLAARRAAVEMRLATSDLWDDDEHGLSARERAELERDLRDLEREERELERRYEATDRDEMGDLGRQMGELGRQMGDMGRRMGELSRKAEREMRDLAREAISTRKAERFGGRSS